MSLGDLIARMVALVRAGYPQEVPETDYILLKAQKVLDTDPHFKYGISLDPAPPAILDEENLVAASQVTQPDGRSVTVRIYQRFDEALRERPIPINVTFLASHATFDQEAFDMWRKYGMPLIAAPAEVETGLPGGLSEMMSGGITQVTIGTVGHTYEARFRIRRLDGTTGPELLFTLTASTGHEGTGVWETGTDTTGLLTFESLTDLETHQGSWGFKQDSIVGKEVVKARTHYRVSPRPLHTKCFGGRAAVRAVQGLPRHPRSSTRLPGIRHGFPARPWSYSNGDSNADSASMSDAPVRLAPMSCTPVRPALSSEAPVRLSITPESSWPWVRTLLHSVFDQPDAQSVAAQYDRITDVLSDKLPRVAAHLDGARAELLAFMAFPK